jgi:hypothetical protein
LISSILFQIKNIKVEQYIENNLPGIPKLEAIKRRTDNTMAKQKSQKDSTAAVPLV